MNVDGRKPVPTTIPGGNQLVNEWLLGWAKDRADLERLESLHSPPPGPSPILAREVAMRLAELRDRFAGLAMQTMIKNPGSFEWYASEAYRLADAMLKAREGAPP